MVEWIYQERSVFGVDNRNLFTSYGGRLRLFLHGLLHKVYTPSNYIAF